MKSVCPHRQELKTLLVFSLLAATAYPQAVPSSTAAPSQTVRPVTAAETDIDNSSGDEEIVLLTPFEVSDTADRGYQATETLAGTRIRTDLRDIASAISVATKELMSDIGATDSQSLLQFMTGAEVGGPAGNFLVGSAVGDASTIDEANALLKPQGNTRVRGLAAADNTRDYFLTDIAWDGYNTSRVDLLRGPNSILFGNGSGAGIINGTPDPAAFGKNSTSIDLKVDDHGSYRTSLNLNRVLIKNELAVRFAVLNDQRLYQQKPAFNHDKRVYGAVRYEPKFLKISGARTGVKVSYEGIDINANRPRSTTINDSISPWFLKTPVELRSPTPLGRPAGMDDTLLGVMKPMVSHDGYDPFVVNVSGTALTSLATAFPNRLDIGARQPFNAVTNPRAEGWLGAVVTPSDSGASQTGNNIDNGGQAYWIAEYDDPNSSAQSRFIYPSLTNFHAVNTAGVRDAQTINGIRGPDITGILRLDQYSVRGVGSFLYTQQGVWRAKTLTDPTFFDFYKKLIDGPNKSERSKSNAFNASLEQSFLNDKIGFQLAYDGQTYADYRKSNLGNPTMRIDIYKYQPYAILNPGTGVLEPVLNPNFGRPFVVSKPSASRSRTRRDVARLTPYADINFSDIIKSNSVATKILGRHTITGLYEANRFERTSSSWTPYALDENTANDIFFAGGRINSTLRSVGTVSYLGPSLLSAESMAGANISPINAVQQPGLHGSNELANAWYFDSHYVSGTSPAAVFTPPAIGLAPNQVGGANSTQSENPLNYAGWGSSPRRAPVSNADTIGERFLTSTFTRTKNQTTSFAIVDQWAMLDRHVVVTAGLRRDKIETYYPGNPALSATDPSRTGSRMIDLNSGVVDWSQPFTYASEPSAEYTSDWLKTYGVVFHAPLFIAKKMPWSLRPSLFFNSSENFQPVNRKDPISGANLQPPEAQTRELGFTLSTPGRRFSAKINWYETKVQNASMPDNGVINFTFDEIFRGMQQAKLMLYSQDINNGTNLSGANPTLSVGVVPTGANGNQFFRPTANSQASSTNLDPSSTHWYPWQPSRALGAGQSWTLQEWQDAELHAIASAQAFLNSVNTPEARQIMSLWSFNPDAFNYTATEYGYTSRTPQSLAITGDTVSRGTEVEIYFSPLDGWDITLNTSKTFATRKNLAGNMGKWLQDRWALYNEPYIGADGALTDPSTGATAYTGLLAGGLRWFGGGQGNTNAANARFGRNGYRFYSEFYSKEGNNVPELRPWRFNGVTSYRFKRGPLKGAFFGASYRWEDKSVIGYGMTEITPERFFGSTSLTDAVGKLDVNKPYYGPAEGHFGAWVGYGRRILKKYDWRIQLNANNVGEENHLVPLTTNPDGSGAAYRIAEGTSYQLSSSIKF